MSNTKFEVIHQWSDVLANTGVSTTLIRRKDSSGSVMSVQGMTISISATGDSVDLAAGVLIPVRFADGTQWSASTLLSKAARGTEGDDEVWGYDIAETINSLGGDDVVGGNAGNDTVDGGSGNDFLMGGTGMTA